MGFTFLKVITLVTIFQAFGCQLKAKFDKDINYRVENDPTYHETHYNDILNEDIIWKDNLRIPSICNWDTVVRIHGKYSWGIFEYICTIYNDDNKRIQLIIQDDYSDRGSNYTYNERILTNTEYERIVAMLLDSGIYEMPFDLEPKFSVVDGANYTIAIKRKEYTKVLFWQSEHDSYKYRTIPERPNAYTEKLKAMRVFKEILSIAQYPIPKGFILQEKANKDLFKYSIGLNDLNLLVDYHIIYSGDTLTTDGQNIAHLYLNKDISTIKDNLTILGTLGNGQEIEIEEINLLN